MILGVVGRALPRRLCARATASAVPASARWLPSALRLAGSNFSSSTASAPRQSLSTDGVRPNVVGGSGDDASPPPARCPVHSAEPSDRGLSEPGVAWAEGVGPSVHYKHCTTCTCGAVNVAEGSSMVATTSVAAAEMGEEERDGDPSACPISSARDPLPPPLPEPKFSFHKRVMPPNLTALSSPEGKRLFLESLRSGDAESYFPLAEQFINQSDPAFCGVTTLCMVLNAMSVDPNVRWRGGWRWYGDDSVVLANCCLDMERVRRAGISVEEFASLGRCQGARIEPRRPLVPPAEAEEGGSDDGARPPPSSEGRYSVERFRDDVRFMVRHPPPYVAEDGDGAPSSEEEGDGSGPAPPPPSNSGGFLVVSYARSALSQTGEGHYSPVAAYHPPTDRALVLDVARFKYAPYWVSIRELYDATIPPDPTTGRSRGWLLMYPPRASPRAKVGGYHGTVKTDEGKRPAETVRNVGEGDICPLGEIKVEFCRAGGKKAKSGGGRTGADGASEGGGGSGGRVGGRG